MQKNGGSASDGDAGPSSKAGAYASTGSVLTAVNPSFAQTTAFTASNMQQQPPPSKSQQLLRKLKLTKKPGKSSATQANEYYADASRALVQTNSPRAPGYTQTRGMSDGELEEVVPNASIPTNPLAPLLTPFKMMKPLIPQAMANKISLTTAAAVAGIKRPWLLKRAAAASAATQTTSSLPNPATTNTGMGDPMQQGTAPTSPMKSATEGLMVPTSESSPPMGYLWVWMGSFKRWQRRFIVASEAPGVLLIYRRMNMKGKVQSISLRDVEVQEDDADPRQIKIVTPKGFVFLRSVLPEERSPWIQCLTESIQLYQASHGLVKELKDQGLLLQQPRLSRHSLSSSAAAGGLSMPSGVSLISSVGGLTSLTEINDMDVMTRKRIRARLTERLNELAPYQREVERHVNQLSQQLLNVVSGLNIRLPSLATSNSLMRYNTHTAPSNPPYQRPSRLSSAVIPEDPPALPVVHGQDMHATYAAPAVKKQTVGTVAVQNGVSSTAHASTHSETDGTAEPSSGSDGDHKRKQQQKPTTAATIPPGPEIQTPDEAHIKQHTPSEAPVPIPTVKHHADHVQESETSAMDHSAPDRAATNGMYLRRNSMSMGSMKPGPAKSTNLQQAMGQLLEAVRHQLYSQAVRIAQLEVENMAQQSALVHMKQQQEKAWRASRNSAGLSSGYAGRAGPGVPAGASGPSSQLLAGRPPALREESSSAEDDGVGSQGEEDAETADEDAFDVTEALDEGVDYGILDHASDSEEDDESHTDISDVEQLAGSTPEAYATPIRSSSFSLTGGISHTGRGSSGSLLAAAAAATGAGLGKQAAGVYQEGVGDDEQFAARETVITALEVVRQVDYVERMRGYARLTDKLATHEPPDSTPTDAEGVTDMADEEDDGGDDDEEEEEEGGSDHVGRCKLPAPRPLGKGFSIWSILKNMIGKDLTRLTMPATINEPTSTLQRLAETLEYRNLLDKAAQEQLSVDRLMMVAVWQVAGYNSQPLRDGKPFNPLLGETYEWRARDGGDARFVCEQVSHHPPVLAYVADSAQNGWQLQGELETKSKFWGKSVEVILWGSEELRIPAKGDMYRWNRANICVQDIILGNYWIEVYGKVRVANVTTGEVATLNLKPCKRRLADRGKFEGTVCDAKGNVVWTLSGSACDKIYAQLSPAAAAERGLLSTPAAQLVWQKMPYCEDAAEQYWFTRFALGLNDPSDPVTPHLPPTDTRFRPDQRALEVGEWNRATTEKLRLEEKQRQARRERGKLGVPYYPSWFKQSDTSTLTHLPDQPGFTWSWTGEYWKRQATKNWSMCPDIYSNDKTVIKIPKVGAQPPSP